ncbi:hypothetical protein PJP14_29545, partial [Mycobacterium kansasii]
YKHIQIHLAVVIVDLMGHHVAAGRQKSLWLNYFDHPTVVSFLLYKCEPAIAWEGHAMKGQARPSREHPRVAAELLPI